MPEPATTAETDVVVIGAGPVGLFAVFACGMLEMRCHVVDALAEVGGQCAALYPEKPIYDIPAVPEISGAGLIHSLMEQAQPFDPVFHLAQRVERLERRDEGFRLATDGGTALDCRAVIIAAGVGAFGPNRPPLPGIEAYEVQGAGLGVTYAVGEVEHFRNRRVVVAGGGDSAVDWALLLADVAASVAVVHRRRRFRAAPASVGRLEARRAAGDLDLVVLYQLAGLEGDGAALRAVIVRDLDGAERRLEADALLAFYGLKQSLGPIAGWGLALERNRIPVGPNTAETNEPGIFAVGDIATYANKQKLILTGFSEASFAAHRAHHYARPGQALHFEHSTHKGVPGKEGTR